MEEEEFDAATTDSDELLLRLRSKNALPDTGLPNPRDIGTDGTCYSLFPSQKSEQNKTHHAGKPLLVRSTVGLVLDGCIVVRPVPVSALMMSAIWH